MKGFFKAWLVTFVYNRSFFLHTFFIHIILILFHGLSMPWFLTEFVFTNYCIAIMCVTDLRTRKERLYKICHVLETKPSYGYDPIVISSICSP